MTARAWPIAAGLVLGCHPPAPPPTPKPPTEIRSAPARPPTARWVDAAGPTEIVASLATGTLVLLGGRRALVTAGGEVVPERTALGEPLVALVSVPFDPGSRIAGLGASNTLYRFDDPLGAGEALGVLERWPSIAEPRIAPGPGLLAVLVGSRVKFVDLDTGTVKPGPSLPDLPIETIAFRSARDGAVAFRVGGAAVTSDGGATYREGSFPARGEPEASAPLLRWIHLTHADPLRIAAHRGVPLGDGTALAFAPKTPWSGWSEWRMEWEMLDPGGSGPGVIGRIDPRSGAVSAIVETETRCTLAGAGDAVLAACSSQDREGALRVYRVVTAPSLALGDLVYEGEGSSLRTAPGGGALIETAHGALVRQRDGRWAHVAVPDGALASPLSDGRAAIACVREAACPSGVSMLAIDPAGRVDHLVDVRWDPFVDRAAAVSPVTEGRDGALRLLVLAGGSIHLFVERPGQPAQRPSPAEAPSSSASGGEPGGASGVARIVGTGAVLLAGDSIRWSEDDGRSWLEEPVPWPARRGPSIGCLERDFRRLGEMGGVFNGMVRVGWGPAAPPAQSQLRLPTTRIDVSPPRPMIHAVVCESTAPIAPPSNGLDPAKDPGAQLHAPPYPLLARATAQLASTGPGGALRAMPWTLRWIDPTETGEPVHSPKSPVSLPSDAKLVWASARAERALFAFRSGARVLLVRAVSGGSTATVEPPANQLPHVELEKEEPPSLLDWMDVAFGQGPGEPIVWRAGPRQQDSWVVWVTGQPLRVFLHEGASFELAPPRDGLLPVLVGSHRIIRGGEAGEQGWAATRLFPLAPTSKMPVYTASPWTRVRSFDGSPAFLTACAPGTTGDHFRATSSEFVPASLDKRWLITGSAIYDVVAGPSSGCVASVTIDVRENPSISTLHADFDRDVSEAGSAAARTTRLRCHLEPVGPPPDPHFP